VVVWDLPMAWRRSPALGAILAADGGCGDADATCPRSSSRPGRAPTSPARATPRRLAASGRGASWRRPGVQSPIATLERPP